MRKIEKLRLKRQGMCKLMLERAYWEVCRNGVQIKRDRDNETWHKVEGFLFYKK